MRPTTKSARSSWKGCAPATGRRQESRTHVRWPSQPAIPKPRRSSSACWVALAPASWRWNGSFCRRTCALAGSRPNIRLGGRRRAAARLHPRCCPRSTSRRRGSTKSRAGGRRLDRMRSARPHTVLQDEDAGLTTALVGGGEHEREALLAAAPIPARPSFGSPSRDRYLSKPAATVPLKRHSQRPPQPLD